MMDSYLESTETRFLSDETRKRLDVLFESCQKTGLDLRTATCVRGPGAQARLWCRSRSVEQVLSMSKTLSNVAPRLASFFNRDFAGLGPELTRNLPGESWHQWGEAADLYLVVAARTVWSGSMMKLVGKFARAAGLVPGELTEPKQRHWHFQLSPLRTPLIAGTSWKEIEEVMKKRFSI